MPAMIVRKKTRMPWTVLMMAAMGCSNESAAPCEGEECVASEADGVRPCTKKRPCTDAGGGGGTGTADGGTTDGGSTDGGSTDGGVPLADGGTVDAAPSGACTGTKHTAGGPDGAGGCWPGPSNTGVPDGISLAPYSGPCTIDVAGTVIDGKAIDCSLSIRAANVTIKNSRVRGSVSTQNSGSFTIVDSEVHVGRVGSAGGTGLGSENFKAIRVEVTGGNRGAWCNNCTIQDSWIHGQDVENVYFHASGVRQDQGATLIHNTVVCDIPDNSLGGGCSASLTGYGDFAPVQNNRIERNLFPASTGGACAYGGSSGDNGTKEYGDQASNIAFVGNVFQRGPTGKCGYWFAVVDFDPSRPGNVFTGNTWEDGATVQPQ
jgi:hypothetical protein